MHYKGWVCDCIIFVSYVIIQASPRVVHRKGTGGLNVPMFIALRRFTLLCTIVLERLMYHKQHDKATYGAVAMMIGGADGAVRCSNF
jgi:hypothetical protein